MKRLIKLFLLFCFTKIVAQINLVPNPSFEDTSSFCPNNSGQINRAKFWSTINGTPDYFHECYNGPSNYNVVPHNSFTYQNPTSIGCKAYAGIFTASPLNNLNEIFAVKLIDTLKINTKYFFSIRTSLSNYSKYATNNLGMFLKTTQPMITSTASPSNFAQITFSQSVNDTLSWTRLFKSFKADSNYRYLLIGNFKDSSLTTKTFVNASGGSQTYYTIDDVCISTDSTFAYNYTFNCLTTDIDRYKKSSFSIYPNPTKNKIKFNSDEEIIDIELYDVNFKNQFFLRKENELFFDLPVGVYFFKIRFNNHKTIHKKIIIN
jgi:hypothetical protein